MPRTVVAALFLAVAAVLSACTGQNAVSSGAQAGDLGYVSRDGTVRVLPVNDRVPAPSLHGESLDGGNLDIRDLVGQVVVVNFWASWCPPCRAEQPRLNAAYAAAKSDGVAFLGINTRDQGAAARAFTRTHHVTYPSIVDESGSTQLDFDIPGIPPSTVVIDRHGRVAAKIVGQTPKGVLEPIIDQLAAESSA